MIKFNTDIPTACIPHLMYKGWWSHKTGRVVSVWVKLDFLSDAQCFARVELPLSATNETCREQLEMLVCIAEARFKTKVRN